MAALTPKPALMAYRALLRARRVAFAGDAEMLRSSIGVIRASFEENRHVSDPDKRAELLLQAQEGSDFLKTQVVQAQLNDRGNYDMKLRREHVGGSIEELSVPSKGRDLGKRK